MLSFKSFIRENDEDLEEAHERLDHHYWTHHTNDPDDPNPERATQMLNIVPYPKHYPIINHALFDNHKKLQLKDVPTHTLVSTQHEVSHEVVGKKLRGEISEHFPEHPVVLHHEGTHYVYDGNHRACVALLKGEPTMKAYVLNAPNGTKLGEQRMRKARHPEAQKAFDDEHS